LLRKIATALRECDASDCYPRIGEVELPVMPIAESIFWTAVVIVIGSNLALARRITTPRIAMQWGSDGKPTWSAPKRFALWRTVLLMLAVRGVIWAAMTYTPQLVHGADAGLIGFAVIVTLSHLYILRRAMAAA
jgi:hypothetical protein